MKLLACLLICLSSSLLGRPVTHEDLKYQDLSSFFLGYEWWYFDAKGDGDIELTIAFFAKNTFDETLVRKLFYNHARHQLAFIHVRTAEGDNYEITQRFNRAGEFQSESTDSTITARLSGNTLMRRELDNGFPEVKILLDLEDHDSSLKGHASLTFTGVFPSHKVRPPMRRGDAYHEWATDMPRAEVNGEVVIETEDGSEVHVPFSRGIGYHDKQWGNTSLSFTADSWYWGHLYTDEYTIIWWDLHPATSWITARYPPKKPYKFLILYDRSGKIYETYDATFSYEGERQTKLGLPFAKRYRIEAKEFLTIEGEMITPMLGNNPFFSRIETRAALNSDQLGIHDTALIRKANVEKIDLRRCSKWLLKEAFLPL